MNVEIEIIIAQLKDTYDGDPWFNRSAKALLGEVSEEAGFVKINAQHSILELVWHMVTWREFTLSRLQPAAGKTTAYFEETDWRPLDHSDKSLWQQGLHNLQQTQDELVSSLQQSDDSLLDKIVPERTYDFRKLLHGIYQHDIYHLGQIAFINKQVKA
jgi:uncharacterized damage-inducible protein DinB